MQQQNIRTHQFDNGLTLVVESMGHVQSAAFSLMVPAGSIFDAAGKNGTASVLGNLIARGAGDLDARELSSALDNLGLQRSEGPGLTHMSFSGATLAKNLAAALPLYGDIVLRPHLPADEFEAAQAGVIQSLRAMEDEPRQKIFLELRRRCYDAPWGLPTEGSLEDVESLTADDVRTHFETTFRPDEAILGVAGNVDFDEIRDTVGRVFGDWQRKPEPGFATAPHGPSQDHIHHESAQTQIGIAYAAVPYRSPEYYAGWAAVSVLSGGMSSRLFTEVREKKGLCYSIHASLSSLRDDARVLCYAGTTTERAQETLDTTMTELKRLGDGIEQDELTRCQARAKSSLVMQQESTMARAGSIARDWYHLGEIRTLENVSQRIDALTVDAVVDYIHNHPARDFTILTIGPEPLELSQ